MLIESTPTFKSRKSVLHCVTYIYIILYSFIYLLADAVDSRLEFPASREGSDEKRPFAYALLLNKPFPLLHNFTMSLYMNLAVKYWQYRQCVFSYKYKYKGGCFTVSFQYIKSFVCGHYSCYASSIISCKYTTK